MRLIQRIDLLADYYFFIGILIISCGLALYICSSLLAVLNDEFMIKLSKRTSWKLAIKKTCGECAAFCIAF